MEHDGPFERVLAAARAGEGWALAELFRDLHPRIRRYLKSLAPYLADDVASDTWLDVVRSLDRFRGDASELRALAFSIARTRLAEVRDVTAGEHLDLEERTAPQISIPSPGSASDIDPALAALDTDAALEKILALPSDEAEVILLRVLGGLSIEEVSQTVGRPSRAVRELEVTAMQHLAIVTTQERTSR